MTWIKREYFFRPIPDFTEKGIWLNSALFLQWHQIESAQFIWHFGMPFVKFKVRTDKVLASKYPSVPLFYRDYKKIKEEITNLCPNEHIFKNALTDSIPNKPYRLFYYLYLLSAVAVSFLFLFGGMWLFGK